MKNNKIFIVWSIFLMLVLTGAAFGNILIMAAGKNQTTQPKLLIEESCNCVQIEGGEYNTSQVLKILEYWKSQADNPAPDSCRFIINTLNSTIIKLNNEKNQLAFLVIIFGLTSIFFFYIYLKIKNKTTKKRLADGRK